MTKPGSVIPIPEHLGVGTAPTYTKGNIPGLLGMPLWISTSCPHSIECVLLFWRLVAVDSERGRVKHAYGFLVLVRYLEYNAYTCYI